MFCDVVWMLLELSCIAEWLKMPVGEVRCVCVGAAGGLGWEGSQKPQLQANNY